VNVLKPYLQTTVSTLLASGKSHREIARITHVDRKAIRRLARRISHDQSKAPGVTTGSISQKPPG
jgi:transposase